MPTNKLRRQITIYKRFETILKDYHIQMTSYLIVSVLWIF